MDIQKHGKVEAVGFTPTGESLKNRAKPLFFISGKALSSICSQFPHLNTRLPYIGWYRTRTPSAPPLVVVMVGVL